MHGKDPRPPFAILDFALLLCEDSCVLLLTVVAVSLQKFPMACITLTSPQFYMVYTNNKESNERTTRNITWKHIYGILSSRHWCLSTERERERERERGGSPRKR